jgi:release factor glutamine methyltransferase
MVEPFIVYEPKEDTYLILEQVREYAFGDVLDMGTGSGILAIEASRTADNVIGADISKRALEVARRNAAGITNISFVYSDLFSYFKNYPMKFDLIIFNPPYLPEMKGEEKEVSQAVAGGRHGYELLAGFLDDAADFLKPDGRIIILFSSITQRNKIHEILEEHAFNYHKLSEKEIPNETLYVYLCEKSDFLNELEGEGITHVKKLTKGHRGIIYTARYNGKKAVVKQKLPESKAVARMANEARWLRVLNKYDVGPRFIKHDKEWFAYYYVDGVFFPEFMEKSKKSDIKKVIIDVFQQMKVLDEKKINKEEMHNPYKHIIVKDSKATLIDFERTHITKKPHNVTQFCQYLTFKAVYDTLKRKGFRFEKRKLRSLAARYKKKMDEENFKAVVSALV